MTKGRLSSFDGIDVHIFPSDMCHCSFTTASLLNNDLLTFIHWSSPGINYFGKEKVLFKIDYFFEIKMTKPCKYNLRQKIFLQISLNLDSY